MCLTKGEEIIKFITVLETKLASMSEDCMW